MALLTNEEIHRRLKALMAQSAHERPFPAYRLATVAGIDEKQIRKMPSLKGNFQRTTREKLSRAFTLLEQGRIDFVRKGWGKSPIITVREDPRPPQKTVARVRITKNGPVIERVALNPARFDVLDEVNK